MSTNFEKAVEELKQLKIIDDNTILDVSEKYNLSILELDKLYTVATDRMIVGRVGYCGFDQNKVCDVQCKYFNTCTKKNGTVDTNILESKIGNVLDSFGYMLLGKSKDKLVYANNKGAHLYVYDSDSIKIVVHPKLQDSLENIAENKKIIVDIDMPEFPEQETGYLGVVHNGLLIELANEEQLIKVLQVINDVKLDYLEKKKTNNRTNQQSRNKRETKKGNRSIEKGQFHAERGLYESLDHHNAHNIDSYENNGYLSIEEPIRTRKKEYGVDEAKEITNLLMNLGLTYISTEHRCNHYVYDDYMWDVYYLIKEKMVVFHPDKESHIKEIGLEYRKITNYYFREFPSQITGYGEAIFTGLGVYVSDEEALKQVICQVFRVNNIELGGTEKVSDPDLSAWTSTKQLGIQHSLSAKDVNSDNKYEIDYDGGEVISNYNSQIQMTLLEEYKKWLKKEHFMDRVIDKHEEAIFGMEGLDLLSISDYYELLREIDEYCHDSDPSRFVKTVFKNYIKFFFEKTQEKSDSTEAIDTQKEAIEEGATDTYRERYFEGFLMYLQSRTNEDRKAAGKRPYSIGSLKTMAINAFYLEKHSEKDFLDWFGSCERIEKARMKLIELFTGRRGVPEIDAKYYIEAMKYLNEYLISINVVTCKPQIEDNFDEARQEIEVTKDIEDRGVEEKITNDEEIERPLTYDEVIDMIRKKKCSGILTGPLDLSGISDEQNAALWAKAILCKDISFIEAFEKLLPLKDFEKVIEYLQKESIVFLHEIEPEMISIFEQKYHTDELSKIVKRANADYRKDREYIKQTMLVLEKEFERRIHDSVKGRVDPEGYSVDPDYDEAFDVNHDDGIAFKRVMEYDDYISSKAKKADAKKLLEHMLKEGLDVSLCKPSYIRSAFSRKWNIREKRFEFSDAEEACIDIILDNGYDINKVDDGGFTLFRYLVRQGNLKAIKYLFEKGADPFIGRVSIHDNYVKRLVMSGFPQDLFVEDNKSTLQYLGKDGILFYPAFNGDKDMLEYLNEIIGGSNFYYIFLKISENAVEIFNKPIIDIRQNWEGTKQHSFWKNTFRVRG